MNFIETEDFPRGGKQIVKKKVSKRKAEENLFPKQKNLKSKKPKKTIKASESFIDDFLEDSVKLDGILTYKTIKCDMLILTCIKHISHNGDIVLDFPGIVYNPVPLNYISDPLMKHLNETSKSPTIINKYFNVGQIVVTKVISIEDNRLQFSVNPRDIYANKHFNSFNEGMLVWTTIQSESDHGYELDFGVKNLRAFLPFNNIDEDKKYKIGELTFGVVQKVETSNGTSLIVITTKQEHLMNAKTENITDLDDFLPGMNVNFYCEKVTSEGIRGKFLENFNGFIDKYHLFNLKKLTTIEEGSFLKAYILYSEPLSKITYLSLRGIETIQPPIYKRGDILTAKIMEITSNGIFLKLDNTNIGLMSNKRLSNCLPNNQFDNEIVQEKYPIGLKIESRILSYNYMQQIYICTIEEDIVKSKYFLNKDVNVGEIHNVKITAIKEVGLFCSLGQLVGFIPRNHVSDTKFTSHMRSKFKVGMTVKARILNIQRDIIFTLKSSLIELDNILCKFSDAKINNKYTGIVSYIKYSGLMIEFFGGVRGFLSKHILINNGIVREDSELREYFLKGQVLNVWCSKIKDDEIYLSLNSIENLISVGQKYNGVVKKVYENSHIEIEIDYCNTICILPINHLSTHLNLCYLLAETYTVGSKTSNLICLKSGKHPILSRREFIAYKLNQFEFIRFEDLKIDLIVRCSFEKKGKTGIFVSLYLLNNHNKILIKYKNMLNKNATYEPQQLVLCKIKSIDFENKNLELEEYEETENTMDGALRYLDSYLFNLEVIHSFGEQDNWKICEYSPGCRVQCKIIELNGDKCLVELPNKIIGRVPFTLYSNEPPMEKDLNIEGTIIYNDYLNDQYIVCLNSKIIDQISLFQSKPTKILFPKYQIKILELCDNVAIGLCRQKDQKYKIVYLPRKYYENDDNGLDIFFNDKVDVELFTKKSEKLLGYPINAIKEEIINKKMEISLRNNDINVLNNSNKINGKHNESLQPILSGIDSFYETADDTGLMESSSSSSDEETNKHETLMKKRKKLTPAEKSEKLRLEEENLSKIEMELESNKKNPQTADQFDRLLLAKPNSSQLWIKYIAMHISAAEFDKARAVGRRGLESIQLSETDERFNLWMALLNLENMYGTKETFDNLFDEAVKCNDQLNIYISVIRQLADSNKLTEMDEKIKKIRSKEKQNTKMWLQIGEIYYKLGKLKEARNLQAASLKSIVDKKRQFDLIMQFAIMEFQMGDVDQAIANFEIILETYPNKFNVWTTYVDQLIKKNKIKEARIVLERITTHKFQLRYMRTLYQKFIDFEMKFGTPDAVETIKQQAEDYVKNYNLK